MENNRLNINRPLLSVRRRTSSQNNNNNNNNTKTESCIPIRPSVESCTTEMMNTGSVPFGWEHSPGRPKNKPIQTIESPPSLPKLPPGRLSSLKPLNNDSVTNVLTKSESTKSTKKETLDLKNNVHIDHDNNNDNDNDDDEDEAYMDALDTLSRGETSLYNCSASGVSGYGSDVKPFGSGPNDPKMRDFMMGRFLPAAKAMASDLPLPQPTFKKNVVKEKPQEVKKVVNVNDNNKMMLRYGPNFLQDISPDKNVKNDENDGDDDDDDEDDDSVYDYNDHGTKSSKLCGLIPRFCSVNPVHGMCVRARLPAPGKRTQTSSSSSNSFRETDSEPARSGIYKHRSLDHILKNEPNQTSNLEGLKLYNRLQGNEIADLSDSNLKKNYVSFKELLADKTPTETETAESQDSIIEKTLYVDSVQIIKSPESDMFFDEPKKDQETKKLDDHEVGLQVVFELPAPPPLPKSPSDSWLCRTLPSVPSKNAHMRWNNKYPSFDMPGNEPKTDDNIRLQNQQGQLYSIPES